MASILIRGIDEDVKQLLMARAKNNQRSMEEEARRIIAEVVRPANIGVAFYEVGQALGGVELAVPPRHGEARLVQF